MIFIVEEKGNIKGNWFIQTPFLYMKKYAECIMHIYYSLITDKEYFEHLTMERMKLMNNKELIGIKECRELRAYMNEFTKACILTRNEYMEIMKVLGRACDRLEKQQPE